MYNFNHLYYFYMTVKSGGVTHAGKHLFISQPSLSSQLKVLEDFLQVKLFKKVGRKNELTVEGSKIYGFCRQMFELSEEMYESLSQRVPYASRRIYIGITSEIANSFVVEVVSDFLKKYNVQQRPKIMMISGSHEKLAEQLNFREIDVLITTQAIIKSDLEILHKLEIPVNLICPAENDKIILKKYPTIREILSFINKGEPSHWVVPTKGFKLRSEINNFFEENSIQGRYVFESDVIESLVRSVTDNVGIAFLPLVYVSKEIENNSLRFFGPKKGFWKHCLWLGAHGKCKNDPLIQSFSLSFSNVCFPKAKKKI
jgi:LysR family transcriptional activator of nhaA